jgi:two-component system, NtrC family, sensor kinase
LMRKGLNQVVTDGEAGGKFARYLELVEKEIGRCSHITANLLAFSRKSPPNFERVSIHELIQRTLLLCGHKLELQRIEPIVEIAQDLATVSGDANQLQQCLLNLIFNAMDAMPKGGRITITSGLEDGDKRVILRVQDTGGGIAEKDLAHVFDHFYTTKQQGYGVGLGLSTVRGIIQRHGGEVRIERTGPSGTTFRIELPAE